jgi:NAD(P)-dependent dehydrogenase (short-subunit alcohol dehydrogenase family)
MPSPVVIVTGASRGLGLAITRALLATHGANVATLQRTLTPELQALADQFPGRVLTVSGDVSKPEDNARVVEQTVAKWGALTGLILNAGTLDPMGKLSEVPLDSLVPSLQTNLLSALYIVQPAIKHLRAAASAENPARVILVSSGASVGAYQAWGMYSLAKAGVNSLARTLAAEEKDGNVVFLSIRPGVVDTDVSGTILCGAGAVLRIAGNWRLRSRSTAASRARSAPEPTSCPEKQAAAPLRTF